MPRDLYHLEGQQLRGLFDRISVARIHIAERRVPGLGHADALLEAACRIIEQILADGPHSRDEQD